MVNKEFTYYLVILADRQRGKFFLWYDDTFTDPGEEVFDDTHQKVKANNGRQGIVDRRIRDQLHKHLKHVGEQSLLYTQHQQLRIAGIILGGHREVLASLKHSLPGKFSGKVIGEFIAPLDLSILELIVKAKAVIPK